MNPKELPESVQCGDVLAAVQLCPFGEWPNGTTVQKCDEVAFNKLVENWHAAGGREIICDFEHRVTTTFYNQPYGNGSSFAFMLAFPP